MKQERRRTREQEKEHKRKKRIGEMKKMEKMEQNLEFSLVTASENSTDDAIILQNKNKC